MIQPVVFHDPSKKRWWWLKRIGLVAGVAAACLAVLFMVSIIVIPVIDPAARVKVPVKKVNRAANTLVARKRQKLQLFALKKISEEFNAEIKAEERFEGNASHANQKSNRIVAGFYTVWQQTALHSLRANAGNLTHLMPEWLHLTPDGLELELYDWLPQFAPHNRDVQNIAHKNNLAIFPVLNNAQRSEFDPARAHALLANPAAQQKIAFFVRDWLRKNRFQGINIDFEGLTATDSARMPAFLKRLSDTLRPAGLQVSADIEAGNPHLNWKKIAENCDFVIVMGYDQHAKSSNAGPIAAIQWFASVLRKALVEIPRDKLVMGIGNYAYDWVGGKPPAEPLSFQQALLTAADNYPGEHPAKILDFDSGALNPTFGYTDDEGDYHEVWMLDAVTAANQWRLMQHLGLRGIGVWQLGSEDPSLWNFVNREDLDRPLTNETVENISYPYSVDFTGEGDILKVRSMPQKGKRRVDADPLTGLYTDEVYEQFPSAFVFEKNGYCPMLVALTFDDGPYEPYTSQILDQLKMMDVKATFFVIGENMERHPDIIERMWREGHEIGNHTYTHPNMGAVTEGRARLELNATERALQSLIGRSTLIFRPPYNADAEPSSAEEVWPVIFASKYGYITVGEFIDPQDWNTEIPIPGHGVMHRTSREIADFVIERVRVGRGNTILFHDGGGNRQETVTAVNLLVPKLRNEGYRFVLVSELLNSTRDAVMPPVRTGDSFMLNADRVVFNLNYYIEMFLRVAFISAIVLGTARLLFVTTLAMLSWWKERNHVFKTGYTPFVTVIIAAFNEEKVIGQTVEAVLNNDYHPFEIIVVDDGSKDNTAVLVERLYGNNPMVRLVHQENQGKASALNNAITMAKGDILICLDADTHFAADTIEKLVRRFVDPRIGAVAGNVKVGNRINVLTSWQAIEYITSQSLDRRAYALFNAVSVIPGAVGAWRKEAVLKAGGYLRDTLAEDMDLTWRIRKAGWKLDNESEAFGYTETPDTIRTLFKQRFRWTFGTLQCLWKHRRMLGRYGVFGSVMLPSLWLFQIVYQILSPLVDLQVLWTVVITIQSWLSRGLFRQDWQPLSVALGDLSYIGTMYLLFFAIELVGSFVAFSMEREKKGLLWWLFWQRFVYRQIMYAVVIKSFKTALQGIHIGWGKLERKGTVVRDSA